MLTYTAVVVNRGPQGARGVKFLDRLPTNVGLISATSSQGRCRNDAGIVTCSLGGLAVGARAQVKIQVSHRRAGQITNIALVTSHSNDLNPRNNTVVTKTSILAGR
jgi:uncharacterized repeat protein (TIGR01451 family)